MNEILSNSTESNAPPENNKPRKRRGPKKPKKITETYLYNSGLYYLQRFAAGTNHFRSVMQRKIKRSCHAHPDQNYEACAKLLENTIGKFQELGYLNDALYISGMITSLRNRGLSKRAILSKMKQKGVSETKTLQALEHFNDNRDLNDGELELRGAVKFIRKKRLGPYGMQDDPVNDKDLAKLARQGFDYQTARRVLEMEKDEAEEILSRFY